MRSLLVHSGVSSNAGWKGRRSKTTLGWFLWRWWGVCRYNDTQKHRKILIPAIISLKKEPGTQPCLLNYLKHFFLLERITSTCSHALLSRKKWINVFVLLHFILILFYFPLDDTGSQFGCLNRPGIWKLICFQEKLSDSWAGCSQNTDAESHS